MAETVPPGPSRAVLGSVFERCSSESGPQASLGITADQVIAQRLGQGTPLPSLELCIEPAGLNRGAGSTCAYRNTIAWQSPTSPLPMENNPQVVFERLFGDGSSEEKRRARRQQSQSLLDSVLKQIGSLEKGLPPVDRERLDQYTTDIREIRRQYSAQAPPSPQTENTATAGGSPITSKITSSSCD